jgi:hypothetical protein
MPSKLADQGIPFMFLWTDGYTKLDSKAGSRSSSKSECEITTLARTVPWGTWPEQDSPSRGKLVNLKRRGLNNAPPGPSCDVSRDFFSQPRCSFLASASSAPGEARAHGCGYPELQLE